MPWKRRDPKWEKWRTKVFKRDKYKCKICGKVGGRINPHHIISKFLFPDLKYRVMNGVTLCYECHMNKEEGKNVHAAENNKFIKKFARYTRLKLPKADKYQIGHA